jgi:hypothetical protein
MFIIALSLFGAAPPLVPDENYDFLSVTDGPCVPKQGVRLSVAQEAECARMSEPRHYRGTWYVGFESSVFTPAGHRPCLETDESDPCIELEGKPLPWPTRWECDREFEVNFIGRRTVHPGFYPTYRIVVDRLISARRLPDPPYDPDQCDPKHYPEPKGKSQ